MVSKKKNDFIELACIPNTVDLGYQKIGMSFYDFLDNEQGAYSSIKGEIKIQIGSEGRELINTIIHEFLHAILYVYGMKKVIDDDEKEEKIVNSLGNGLTEIFLRNPKIIDLIKSHASLE